MRFDPGSYIAPTRDLITRFATLFPEYLPGTETGPAALTDTRTCWIRSMQHLLQTLGHEHGVQVCSEEKGEITARKQLRHYWKKGDAIVMAAFSGWGERDDLERSFQALEALKAPQKIIVYTCARWHDAVLEQLAAALQRYPDHIEGEEYIALNLLPAESKILVCTRRIVRSGPLKLHDAPFEPLPGSPFSTGSPARLRASYKL